MKKISILLMLCFAFSFGAFASNVITKEKKNHIEKNGKILPLPCFRVESYDVECPDGGYFVGGVDIIFTNCSTGAVTNVVSISDDWGDNPCNEDVDGGF